MCRIFGEKANIVGPWIERQMYSVVTITMGVDLTPEELLSKLSQHQMAVKLYRTHMDELEAIHRDMQKESITREDRYTPYKMEVLIISQSIY